MRIPSTTFAEKPKEEIAAPPQSAVDTISKEIFGGPRKDLSEREGSLT